MSPFSKQTRLEHYKMAKAYYEKYLETGEKDSALLNHPEVDIDGWGVGMCFIFSIVATGWYECALGDAFFPDKERDHLSDLLACYPELKRPETDYTTFYVGVKKSVKERLDIVEGAIASLENI